MRSIVSGDTFDKPHVHRKAGTAVNDIFTTREAAVALWALALVAWAATKPEVRKSVGGGIRAALQWKLLVPFLLIAVYTALAVRGMHTIGLWTPDLLKDTILWFVFSGLALAFSGLQSDLEGSVWRRVLLD